jgi:hypothetical protein
MKHIGEVAMLGYVDVTISSHVLMGVPSNKGVAGLSNSVAKLIPNSTYIMKKTPFDKNQLMHECQFINS